MNKKPIKKSTIFSILKKIKLINLGNEKIELNKSINRFLDKEIISKINLPPFNNSAVDGYALIKRDIKNKKVKFKLKNRLAAGDSSKVILKTGEVCRVFTGAKMPINSKTVIMQENVNKSNNEILIKKIPSYGENCRLLGEDIAQGKKIISKGDLINTQNINLIAAIGKKYVSVKNKIKIGFFSSGNELIDPKEKLKESQIYNSNFYSLDSLLDKPYIKKKYLGILKDNAIFIKNKLLINIDKFHVIITTGGASVGEEDHLIKVLKQLGKIYFWKTAIKPGRPLAIGKIKNTFIICLPGNPVSVHLLYAMIIKPFINYLCSGKIILPKGNKIKTDFSMKKKNNRLEWLRVNISVNKKEIIANKFEKQGSGMISSIAFADGILEIPENVKLIKKGDFFMYYSFKYLFDSIN